MATNQDGGSVPAIRFKRRKLTQSKRIYTDKDIATNTNSVDLDVEPRVNIASPPKQFPDEEDDSGANLKGIIRNRKRPRDRLKETTRKGETPKTEVALLDTPREGCHTTRFVAQTGQVVDRDDKQMTKYVEARLAEQNHRQYGWPIPSHLQTIITEIAPDLKHTFVMASAAPRPAVDAHNVPNPEHSIRLAAGMGKIEEVDITPTEKRTDEKWRRLENGGYEQIAAGKARLGREGKPRRPPKRRNSEDVRRDQLVEAVFSEAKLDYFDAPVPTNPHESGTGNNDEAVLARFQAEYYESVEEARQQRKSAPTLGAKGAKEAPKGPKLGGSKSIRAKMRLAEEQAAKTKR
ncbi:hypothetical protein GQ44DRAFT_610534 [Phaeosphaeriaceae sp. PMI808]|nr:hypothetical protein GQ44DRAFT_610534 [Phaeosphaeriaceae sp. PMI808]